MKPARNPVSRHRTRLILAAVLTLAAAGLTLGMLAAADTADEALAKADKLFKDQNWAEARTAYDHARESAKDWHAPQARAAVEGAVACSVHLQKWDDALQRAQDYITQTKGSLEEAVGERFLAGLYMSVPHQGTKQGGKYLRGQYSQGVHISSFKKDRQESITHYERARTLLVEVRAKLGGEGHPDTPERRQLIAHEQIGTNFDLAGALAMRDPYRGYRAWDWWWGTNEAEEDSQAVEDADYEEPRWYGWRQPDQRPPTGVPLGPDGKPSFIPTPQQYAPTLGDGAKIRFLLEEVRKLDTSTAKNEAARALFRRAMIARSLYGPESRYGWYGPRPEDDADTPKKQPWELGDDEAITIVGGHIRQITLPADESPLALLRLIAKEYPKSDLVPEAAYTVGLFYQTRQQFPQALREYQALIETHAQHTRAKDAQTQIATIEKPGITLEQTGVYLPDTKLDLKFTYRNGEAVEFKANEIDLYKLVRDQFENLDPEHYWSYWNVSSLLQDDKGLWKKHLGRQVTQWSEKVPRPEGYRVGQAATVAPLTKPGAYVVEAQVPGSDTPSRVLILITDVGIVQKNLPGKGLIWLVNARTGEPLADKSVRIYERWRTWNDGKGEVHLETTVQNTNADGVIEYTRKHPDHGADVDAIVSAEDGRMAYSFFQSWHDADYQNRSDAGPRYYTITDRPVYRPGNVVHYRSWLRNRDERKYAPPPANQNATVTIYDPKGNTLQTLTVETDEFGCISGQLQLGDEPPLGMYQIRVNGIYPDAVQAGGGLFRVEEYRKPEFEVLVKPSTTQARLGDQLKARIEARYYFGAPVSAGEVTYKVYRENYQHVYAGPGEYDWLYGRGYGHYYYPYPWFPWWGRWGCFLSCKGPWPGWYGYYDEPNAWARRRESGTRNALRDLVLQGRGTLAADGSLEIDIDTAAAKRDLADRDHRYTIEAEVRDASRRTIAGSGSVKVTRQAFYAFVEAERGWYQPGHEAFIEVRTLTPDNVPVAAKGEVYVYRVHYSGPNNAESKDEEIKHWPAETDAQGRLSFRYQIPGEGQYRLVFKTKDTWGEEVLGNALFWAAGPHFEGKEFRFNDLEIIADKRTYKIGETAHLLLNTAANHSRILFSDDATGGLLHNYRFIDLPGRSMVIDVPIKDNAVPNFFVEATLARDGRLASEMRELFVPPTGELLNITLHTDKPTYKPGETGVVDVAVTTPTGQPVTGQVTLTAFDEAVTYIQDETGPSPKIFFHGQKRYHNVQADSSFGYTYYATGGLTSPEHQLGVGSGIPEGWNGWWPTATGSLMGMGAGYDAYSRRAGGPGGMATNSPAARPASEAGGMGGFGGGSRASGYLADSLSEMSDAKADLSAKAKKPNTSSPQNQEPGAMADAEIRTNFADTALWLAALKLDADGKAQTKITFPQSLTTWRVRGYALTNATQVGDATANAVTTKNLLVRLQAPRFFVERDEVVLSANVHNYLKTPKRVVAELIVPAALFTYLGPTDKPFLPDAEGNLHLRDAAEVQPEGEHRFDWPVQVTKEGFATITVKALTDEESDASRLAFPVLVHGINKTVAQSGSFRVDQDGQRPLTLQLPEQIDPEQTRLEITLSPSLAAVLIDALPYLTGYPYGCTEQTMSRFYPSVLVAAALKKSGTNLEEIAKQRKQMNPADVEHRFGRYPESPVFDSKELERMVQAGLQRIYAFQHSDGGWGWWREDDSSPYQTAYVLQGLHEARQAGTNVDGGIYERGLNYVLNFVLGQLNIPKKEDRHLGDPQSQAFFAYVLSLDKRLTDDKLVKWLDELYADRAQLNNYGRALLALALHNMDRKDEAQMLLRNLLQFVDRDDSNETAWVRTPGTGWWFWWNNDIETNAWALRALVRLDPKNDLGPRLVKWLLNNRRNGYYWRSTRDTALTINAMIDYMQATGEATPEYTLVVSLDGQPLKEITVTRSNFFTFDNRIGRYGLQVKPGAHELTIAKKGPGALYYSAYLSYFTKEDAIKGAGNEIFVERQYFKLVPKVETVHFPDPGAAHTPPAGQPNPLTAAGRTEQRAIFERIPLKLGDTVTSGDQIEVVLNITSKNVYDYLAFEDMKPAGCEPVELRSGGRWAGGLCANLELRDEKVVFFIGLLEQGTHTLRYRLRAETPGTFHALPTTGFAMYAPEIRAISDEMHLKIKD